MKKYYDIYVTVNFMRLYACLILLLQTKPKPFFN